MKRNIAPWRTGSSTRSGVVDATTLTFLYISPSTYEIRGFTQEETIDQPLEEIIVPESMEKLLSLLDLAQKELREGSSQSHTAEIAVHHKNGSQVWLEISAKLIQEKNEPPKIVGITRNINKRKKAEKEKDRLLEELQEALQEKDRLLEEIKRLESLLPICSGCRRIRHKDNSWWPLEKYVEEKAGSRFTHTICPDCRNIYYPPKTP